MSERYTKVFELSKNLYTENAPLVISAGALLKDNQTGKILAQLKFRNITNKVIKAVKISIKSFDIVGKQIDDNVKHEYLDLSVSRDSEFGQKIPVTLTNNSTRSFSVSVDEIVFFDNNIWNDSGRMWETLKESKPLSSVLDDLETVKQYKIEYGEKCEFEVTEDKDIWICSCGKINKQDESKCFNCGCSLQTLKNADFSKLNENKNKRVKAEKEQATKDFAKKKKLIAIIAIVIVILIAVSVISVNHNKKIAIYNEAIQLIQSDSLDDIEKGVELMRELHYYKDGKEYIYNKAKELMLVNPEISANYFDYIGDYKDSVEQKQKSILSDLAIYSYDTGKLNINDVINQYNATPLSNDEIKKHIVGSWIFRSSIPTECYTFYPNGTYELERYISIYSYPSGSEDPSESGWATATTSVRWYVENDEIKIVYNVIKKEYGKEDVIEEKTDSFKLARISDDIIISYGTDASPERVQEIYIAKDSNLGKECIDHYNKPFNRRYPLNE